SEINLDLYNQPKTIEFLVNSLRHNRLAHSYLFSGVEGLGKLEIARYFVKLIQCLNPKDDYRTPCGECGNCRKIEQGIFVDNLEIDIAEDKTTISIDQFREELGKFLKYSANESRYKTCIINQFEKTREEAMSAILKTLEEPPKNFIFILITGNVNQLKQTILSRCQLIKFREQTLEQVESRLIKYYNLDKPKARTLALLSAGRIKTALSYIESDIYNQRVLLLEKLSKILLEKSFFENHCFYNFIAANFLKADKESDGKLKDKRKKIMYLLDIILHFFRDLLVIKQFNDKRFILNIDFEKDLKKLSENYSQLEIQKFIHNTIYCEKLLYFNVNPNMIFENIFL
ncbi:MAG TPA: hypothetical protein PLM75_11445, partial [bacterium]|nr:hypothetical protein [bacterium]